MPEAGHPIVRELFAIAIEEQMSMREIARRAGVCEDNISLWKKGAQWSKRRSPNLASIEACLKPLGYKLAIVPESFYGIRLSYDSKREEET